MFDVDGSGKIDNVEVQELLQGDSMSNVATKEAIAQAMKEIDENGDGELDFEEFKLMMKKCSGIWFKVWIVHKNNKYNKIIFRNDCLLLL